MSKQEKKLRADNLLAENAKIYNTLKKLCRQYSYNHSVAKSLYKKAQIEDIPNILKVGGYIGVTFDY